MSEDLPGEIIEASTPEEVPVLSFDEEKPKKKGSLVMALIVGAVMTIVIGFTMGSLLDVQGNLVHRYIAYMLGILVIFVMSVISRSFWKMILMALPVVLGIQFGLAFALPAYFAAPMAPFVTVIPTAIKVVTSSTTLGIDVSEYQLYIDLVDTYGIALDFVIALLIGFFATIGLVNLTKLFTSKPGVFTIFQFLFGTIFFVIGVILLPYLLIIVTGVAQFSMAFGIGGLALNEGFNLSTQGDIDGANEFFEEATYWFNEADAILSGINDMKVFALISYSIPDIQALIVNAYTLIQAGVDLAKGVGPALAGVAAIQRGIDLSMGALGDAALEPQGTLSLSANNLDDFNEGIAIMESGFDNLIEATPAIEEAVGTLLGLDDDALLNSVETYPQIEGAINEDNLDLIRGGAAMFLSVLDVFKVLISDTDPESDTISSPFVHLLKGALSLSDASGAIGDSSSFEGTESVFRHAISNFTIVVDAMKSPVFKEFERKDVGKSAMIIDTKKQMQGIFNFIADAGEIAISVGEFGLVANPVINTMNQTLSVYSDPQYDNFTMIPDAKFDSMVANLTNLYPEAEYMAILGAEVDYKVSVMANNTNSNAYGFMNSQAGSFVSTFQEFSLAENSANMFYLIGGFIGLTKTIKILSNVDARFKVVQSDLDIISALDTGNFDLSQVEIIQNTLGNVNNNLTIINTRLGSAIAPIGRAVSNFSLIGDSMPQMARTADSLDNIQSHIIDIQCYTALAEDTDLTEGEQYGMCRLILLTTEDAFLSDPPTSIDDTNAKLNGEGNDIGQIAYITGKFGDIQTELGGVSMSA
ncbi:MAG: hypothetical protein INQ03_14470 [Candidatus Heimdallarchaeota archaeon]|nr:hypothetical protein [Candidatus Heimdallarchaeota archaeon]